MAVDVDVDMEETKPKIMFFPLVLNVFFSFLSYLVTVRAIPRLKEKFIKANLFGIDMSKTTSDKM